MPKAKVAKPSKLSTHKFDTSSYIIMKGEMRRNPTIGRDAVSGQFIDSGTNTKPSRKRR